MQFLVQVVFLSALITMPIAASAQTSDGETPAMESVCDDETGTLKGLCNAYCEAMDCHLDEAIHAAQAACDRVLANYRKKSGDLDPPCLNAGCAATAAAHANAGYESCLADRTCDTCNLLAKNTFDLIYDSCRGNCSGRDSACRVELNDCSTACGGDHDCVVQCKEAFTACTNACVGPPGEYIPTLCEAPPK